MSSEQGDTSWGAYLDEMTEIKEILEAFRDRGCPMTLYEAVKPRE